MRPIGGREHRITKSALHFSEYQSSELVLTLANLSKAPNKKEAEIAKIAIRRVLRIRHGDNWRTILAPIGA